MTISLSFAHQRKIISFFIEDRTVIYRDENWPHGVQIYPMQKANVKAMIASRSPKISAQGVLIADANMGKNLEEYEKCKTEEDLARMIRDECRLKGLVEIK